MASRHGALVSAVISYIHARGGIAWKTQTGRLPVGTRYVHTGTPGLPDVIGTLPPLGRLIAVEVKAGKDTLTVGQRAMHAELERRGALVVVVRRLQDIAAALK